MVQHFANLHMTALGIGNQYGFGVLATADRWPHSLRNSTSLLSLVSASLIHTSPDPQHRPRFHSIATIVSQEHPIFYFYIF